MSMANRNREWKIWTDMTYTGGQIYTYAYVSKESGVDGTWLFANVHLSRNEKWQTPTQHVRTPMDEGECDGRDGTDLIWGANRLYSRVFSKLGSPLHTRWPLTTRPNRTTDMRTVHSVLSSGGGQWVTILLGWLITWIRNCFHFNFKRHRTYPHTITMIIITVYKSPQQQQPNHPILWLLF